MNRQERKEYAKRLIITTLQTGKENAVTRKYLADKTKLNDRAVRHIIAELQEKDEIAICSFSSQQGYFYPADVEETLHALREKKKRAIKCFNGSKALKRYIADQAQGSFDFEENV